MGAMRAKAQTADCKSVSQFRHPSNRQQRDVPTTTCAAPKAEAVRRNVPRFCLELRLLSTTNSSALMLANGSRGHALPSLQ